MSHRTLALAAVALIVTAATQLNAQQVTARKPDTSSASASAAEQTGRVTRVRELLGLEILNEAGESYGVIDDLLLNKTSGQVEYVLVAPEKDSRELYPMPWKSLALYQGENADDQYVVVGMEREQFVKAPTITRQELPTMTYTQWNAYVPQVTSYYGPINRPAEVRAIRRATRAIRRAVD
ncbi:hypothetical protein GC163_04795 [bacterium]|nr:hypothetical protein [bacterium]